MTLRQKLIVTFAVVLVLVGFQAIVTVLLLTQVVEGSAQLVRPALTRVDLLAHAEADILRLRTLEYTSIVSATDPVRQEAAKEMDYLRNKVQERLHSYGGLQLDRVRTLTLSMVLVKYQGYLDSQQRVAAAIQRGDPSEALREYLRFQPTYQELDDQIHALRHQEYTATEALRDEMVHAAIWARWPLGIVAVLVALAELGLGWYISRSLTQSLDILQQGARRIADEAFGEPVPAPPEADLAALADTLNAVMRALAAHKGERVRLEEERLHLMRERLSQVVRAQEEERARVSRELHDQAGQALTALHYGLTRVQRLSQDAAVAAEIGRLITLAADTSRQVGALARDLRPAVLDDLGLVPALRSYIREFSERIALPIDLSLSGSVPRLSSDAETTVFRVVQEALTNVAKHAQASRAWVELAIQSGQLEVEVRDDGRGFNYLGPKNLARASRQPRGPRPGLGLAGIQERVQLLGGLFTITSEEGKGTVLRVVFPVNGNVLAPAALVKEEAVL